MTGFFIPLGKSAGEKRKEKGAGVGGELWRNLKSRNSSECDAKDGGRFDSRRRIRRTEERGIEERQATRQQGRKERGAVGGFEGNVCNVTTRDRKEKKKKKKKQGISLPLLKQRSLRTADKRNSARGPSKETRSYANIVMKDHEETSTRRKKRELFVKHPNDRRERSRRRLVLTDLKAKARYERLTRRSEARGPTEGGAKTHEKHTQATEETDGQTPRRDDSWGFFHSRERRRKKEEDEGGEGGTKGGGGEEEAEATVADNEIREKEKEPVDGVFSVERKKRWRFTSEEADEGRHRKFHTSPVTYESNKREAEEPLKPSIGLSKRTYVRKTRRGQILMNDMIRKLVCQIEAQT